MRGFVPLAVVCFAAGCSDSRLTNPDAGVDPDGSAREAGRPGMDAGRAGAGGTGGSGAMGGMGGAAASGPDGMGGMGGVTTAGSGGGFSAPRDAGGSRFDAGPHMDSGTTDHGTQDAGAEKLDAGVVADAGLRGDASLDASMGNDAATSLDAGPPPYACDESRAYRFRAHGQPTAGDNSAFDVVASGGVDADDPDLYQCFYFRAPWDEGAQAMGFAPLLDNEKIVAGWTLFGSDSAPDGLADGGMQADCQLQGDPNRVVLARGAPGIGSRVMPSDVGLQLPAGEPALLTLEIHYHVARPDEPALDRTGVELCVTETPREHEAAPHWLGTENINIPYDSSWTASDTCTPPRPPRRPRSFG